ncbi:hypothetical protein KKD52_00435 [Myxococcota bacterium]|nr:hypothetical protein [Myxococcota bacterium]MBU1411841.1 hypothetical protein [Myxococcota bacterium]MBU1508798.1 hypothetical protein [Myxococcota bacterium]
MKVIRTLKQVVAGALSAGATMLIAACYGPMEPGYELANGSVTVPEGTPTDYNVEVCAELAESGTQCDFVRTDGSYLINVYESALDDAQLHGYRLCATSSSGLFIDQCVDVPPNSQITTHDFDLEFIPQE